MRHTTYAPFFSPSAVTVSRLRIVTANPHKPHEVNEMNLFEAYGKAQGKQEDEAKKKKKPIQINPKGLLKSVSERRKKEQEILDQL
jgi:hypothetical protein